MKAKCLMTEPFENTKNPFVIAHFLLTNKL